MQQFTSSWTKLRDPLPLQTSSSLDYCYLSYQPSTPRGWSNWTLLANYFGPLDFDEVDKFDLLRDSGNITVTIATDMVHL